MKFKEIWNSKDEGVWRKFETDIYRERVIKQAKNKTDKQLLLEDKLEEITISEFLKMNVEDFYVFLLNDFITWKYTACNINSIVKVYLKEYENYGLNTLENILQELKHFIKNISTCEETDYIKHGLQILINIKGIGVAGASGLLALLLPEYFGTVDQFAIKNIQSLDCFNILKDANPYNISLKYAIELGKIYLEKAKELNSEFENNYWTPRKIDKVVWAYRK